MKPVLPLNREGFVTHFLVSGPVVTPFTDDHATSNQLEYEAYLRSIVADKDLPSPQKPAVLGEQSRIGKEWEYYFSYGNWFVDYSSFYFTLQKIEIEAATELVAEHDCEAMLRFWSYAALDIWCNNEHVGQIPTPRYKPIMYLDSTVQLKKGVNTIYLSVQNLAVRDTRTLFGLQVKDHRKEITVSLDGGESLGALLKAGTWLEGITLQGNRLTFPFPAPKGALLGYDSKSLDHAQAKTRIAWVNISGKTYIEAEQDIPNLVARVACNGQNLERKFEILEKVVPKFTTEQDSRENQKAYYARMAAIQSLDRGGLFGFSMPHILARRAIGVVLEQDREALLATLQQIEDRYDCSDFLLCGLIRYMKNYEVDQELQARIDSVLLGYRYWMTMQGSDAMCFWSENHALQFYSCAYLVGLMYPSAFFWRAGKTGTELAAFGEHRLNQWFDEVESQGFEEFLSTCYMCVTFASLINLVDYGKPAMAKRAWATLDRLLGMLSLHTFDGSVIAPMGRVYRNIIYPFAQGAQVLMNLANPKVPTCDEESWMASYATSSYRFPAELADLMANPAQKEYETGSALVRIEKTPDYLLSSVQSPRMDGFERKQNLTLVLGADTDSNAYVKSLNERFHGTTCFEPGVYGYQQHMWVAALSKEAILFANHPGGTYDDSSLRPGYWYGNGIMPAVKQENHCIGSIYEIREEYPIHFIHVFLSAKKFEVVEQEGNWFFLAKGKGLLAFWCSEPLTPHDDQLAGCEWRAYTDRCGCFCYAGQGDFASFKQECRQKKPVFCRTDMTLGDASGFSLTYGRYTDETQYI